MAELTSRKAKADEFVNKAFGVVTMSAANTLTFAQIIFGVGMFQGIALVIHRLRWTPTAASIRELVAVTDDLNFALTSSNRVSAIHDASDPAIVSNHRIIGMGAGVEPIHLPIVDDFTMLPGGGLLIPANPVFVAAVTNGAAAASVVRVQLDFTFRELNEKDYLELLQGVYPANVA